MNFIEALSELRKGKKVRDKYWDKDRYIYLNFEVGKFINDGGYIYHISPLDDFSEDRWEFYEGSLDSDGLKMEAIKYRILNYCIGLSGRFCEDCVIEHICQKDSRCGKLSRKPRSNLFRHWSNQEVKDAYEKLKEEKEIQSIL